MAVDVVSCPGASPAIRVSWRYSDGLHGHFSRHRPALVNVKAAQGLADLTSQRSRPTPFCQIPSYTVVEFKSLRFIVLVEMTETEVSDFSSLKDNNSGGIYSMKTIVMELGGCYKLHELTVDRYSSWRSP